MIDFGVKYYCERVWLRSREKRGRDGTIYEKYAHLFLFAGTIEHRRGAAFNAAVENNPIMTQKKVNLRSTYKVSRTVNVDGGGGRKRRRRECVKRKFKRMRNDPIIKKQKEVEVGWTKK